MITEIPNDLDLFCFEDGRKLRGCNSNNFNQHKFQIGLFIKRVNRLKIQWIEVRRF